jgi:hypothetical protein
LWAKGRIRRSRGSVGVAGILGAANGNTGSRGFFYLDGKERVLGGGGGVGSGKVD